VENCAISAALFGETKTDSATLLQTLDSHHECSFFKCTLGPLDPLLDSSSGSIIYACEDLKCMLQRKVPNKKADLLQQGGTSEHRPRHTQFSGGGGGDSFVGCNRTNFGGEPLLMSWSLMCKSSSPSARLIQSPHNPAQVQLCSLLHNLSAVPNAVRPLTTNKRIPMRKKTHTHMQPCRRKSAKSDRKC